MSKNLIFVFGLLFAAPVLAAECVDKGGADIYNDSTKFIELIEKSQSCHEASELAEACAWGSSMDVQTAGAAYGVCQKEFETQNPPKGLVNFLGAMQALCEAKYSNQDGTMYRSMEAYCGLSALKWVLGLSYNIEN